MPISETPTPAKSMGPQVPAYGVAAIFGVEDCDGDAVFRVGQVNSSFWFDLPIVVNGPTAIAVDGYGGVHFGTDRPVQAKYDGSTPHRGETWGPKPGTWALSKGLPGFRILDTGQNGIVWCVRDPAAPVFLVKLVSELKVNESATAAFCTDKETSLDVQDEVYTDLLKEAEEEEDEDQSIKADTWGYVTRIGDKWKLFATECDSV